MTRCPNPTKFNMGDVPRTSTGLVPACYRRQMDDMSTPRKWRQLPKQPKPVLYPYRGDFVNRRNKRALDARQRSKRRQDGIGSASRDCRNDGEAVGNRTLMQSQKMPTTKGTDKKHSCSADCAPSKSSIVHSKRGSQMWDSYCKDESCHQFSAVEERARTQNKINYLSFLRSEASKRKAKEEMERKLQAEIQEENGKSFVKKDDQATKNSTSTRKPPVPRLSRQGRISVSGTTNSILTTNDCSTNEGESRSSSNAPRLLIEGSKATTARNAPPPKSKDQKCQTQHNQSKEKSNRSPKQPRMSYLDFISKKPEKLAQSPQAGSPSPKSTRNSTKQFKQQEEIKLESRVKYEASSVDENDQGDDDSKFRNQIERIVERAAEMVLKERRIADAANRKDSIATSADASKETDAVDVETVTTSSGTDSGTDLKQSSDKPSASNFLQFDADELRRRLSILEERVKNVSSPNHKLTNCENIGEEKTGSTCKNDAIVHGSPPGDSPPNNGHIMTKQTAGRQALSSESSTISEVTTDIHLLQHPHNNFHRTDRENQSPVTDSCSTRSNHISDGDSSTELFPRFHIQPMHLPRRLYNSLPPDLLQIDEGTSFSSFPTALFDECSDQHQMNHRMSIATDTQRNMGDSSYQHSLSYSEDSLSDFFPRTHVEPTNFPGQRIDFTQIDLHQLVPLQPEPNAGQSGATEFIMAEHDEPPMPRGYEMYQSHQLSSLQHDGDVSDNDLFSLLG
ncbi:hypothetical protein ACHAXS_014308 [Conticribra weissflogii]